MLHPSARPVQLQLLPLLLSLIIFIGGAGISAINADTPSHANLDAAKPAAPITASQEFRELTPTDRPVTTKQSEPHSSLALVRQAVAITTDRQAAPATVPPSAKADAIDLTAAERLLIKFQGYAELTGEYRVGADENITIPVLGRISITGVSPSQLETILSARIASVVSADSYVTVEIAEYRPVFVSGYVSRPGSSPWRPGMTVLHAMAMAGGVFRAGSETGGGSGLGVDAELVRWQKAVAAQKGNLATLARLEAEKNETAEIALPENLIALVGRVEAEALIKEQTSALTNRRAALQAKRAALARATEMAIKELAGLTDQSNRADAQLSRRQNYKKKLVDLQSKGYVREERTVDESSRVSDLEDRITIVAVAIARVQGTLASLERDAVNLVHERLAAIDAEIFTVGRNINQLDIEIDAARMNYSKLSGQDPPKKLVTSEAPKTVNTLKYEIVRQTGNQAVSLKADQLKLLMPGDMLVVSVE